jgi:hypothetical protein
MKTALNTFREYSASISGYLFHSILGHTLEPTLLRVQAPKKGFNVPGLPDLNFSQVRTPVCEEAIRVIIHLTKLVLVHLPLKRICSVLNISALMKKAVRPHPTCPNIALSFIPALSSLPSGMCSSSPSA